MKFDIRALEEAVREEKAKAEHLFSAMEESEFAATAVAAYEAQTAILDEKIKQRDLVREHQSRMRNVKVDGPSNQPPEKFSGLKDFFGAVMRADQKTGALFDPRLTAVNASGEIIQAGPTGLNEGLGPDGGWLVGTDVLGPMMDNVWDNSQILSRIRKVPVSSGSNRIVMNGVDETSRANGQRWGGVMAYWLAEAAQKQPSRPKWKRIEMALQKLAILIYATDELLQDSDALTAWMSMAAEDEFNFRLEDAIVNGPGAGIPLGLLFSDAMVEVTPNVATPSKSITPKDVAQMWARLPPGSRTNAVWLISPDLEINLNFFANIIQNVAGTDNVAAVPGQILYTPPGVAGNAFGTLMGRPVIPTEYNAAAGTVGDIILADLTQYLAITKGDVQEQSSIHVRFIYDETCFRFVYRCNGQPMWTVPITPKNGSVQRSPFITLGERP